MLREYIGKRFNISSDFDIQENSETHNIEVSLNQCSGKDVALHCHPKNLIKWAIELDGIASSVLLVPFDACAEFLISAEKKLNLDFVLTDNLPNTRHWTINKRELVINKESVSLLEPLKTNWLLTTSGTTGSPKIVSHTIESLSRTTAKRCSCYQLTWGLLYDPSRFAGFQVVLQAIMADAKLIVPSPSLDFERKIEYLAANGCNALSATPSLWRKILMARSKKQLHLKQITLGGEIADQRVLNSLIKLFPTASITHIFASTEAGVGFAVKDVKAGFPLSWLEKGIRDVELRISDTGTLCLRNTHLNQQYLGGVGSIADSEGWIDTGDSVKVKGDRVLFKGRLNGAINIAGNKVVPEEVEARILEVKGVHLVLVRGKNSSIAGALVEALVVPTPEVKEYSALIKSIKQYCIQVLPSFKVPAFVRIVDELPIGAAGKIKR